MRVALHEGDCRDVLRTLPDDSIDACVTDPPYHLTTGKKGGTGEASVNRNSPAGRSMISTGFMGTQWDGGDIAFRAETWAEVLRVLKPGGHVAVFGGTRTYHRLACAIEDAGFEIRDQLAWAFGTGFPKGMPLGRHIDNPRGWWDETEIERGDLSHTAAFWDQFDTALKPAWEPICLARKPLSEGTVAANVLRWGTGAINVDGCRIEVTDAAYAKNCSGDRGHAGNRSRDMDFAMGCGSASPIGRWPANLCHDGSDEVVALLGSAARFFYSVKASKADRCGSKHPTVKPVKLKQWLARMVTPPGGTIVDPFAGSGTTGAAARLEGFGAVLIEREAEYATDIRRRFAVNPLPTRGAVAKTATEADAGKRVREAQMSGLTPRAHTQNVLKRMQLASSVPGNLNRDNDAVGDNYGLTSAASSDASSFKMTGAPTSPHMGRPGRQAGGRISGELQRTRRTAEETAADIASEDRVVNALAKDREGRARGGRTNKGKTTVNVIIGGRDNAPPPMPPMPPPMPPPPMAAPGPVGPPRPPPGLPPGLPGMAGAPMGPAGLPPPGVPPMLRARGGRIEIDTPGRHDYGKAGVHDFGKGGTPAQASFKRKYGGGSGLGRMECARKEK